MYASRVKGKKLTFAVSGMLWNRSLIMIDEETKSLWSQLLGEAMEGELKGADLETIPSVMTDWRSWVQQHPKTTVLDMRRTRDEFVRDMYENPARWVIGMIEQGTPRAWPMDQLRKHPLVNDQVDDVPVVILFDKDTSTTYAYYRTLDGNVLQFAERDGQIIDTVTKSVWNRASGEAIAGKMKGKHLRPAVTILSFRRPWNTFHPDSSYWRGK